MNNHIESAFNGCSNKTDCLWYKKECAKCYEQIEYLQNQCRALERENLELTEMLRRQEQANKGLRANQPQERTNDD